MDTDLTISVLIPAYNEALLLGRTLDAVHHSFAANAGTVYEIIVCDNNSTDATAAIAQAHGARVVFEPHNQIARARNAAARAALGRWLIFVDADSALNPELLRETLAVIAAGDVGAGGALVRLDVEELPRHIRMIVRGWNRISTSCRLAAGAYLFCRRDAWADTGGFDETVYASEEIWFSRDLKAWCRARGLRFQIITSAPIITSARKMQWYTPSQMLRHLLLLCWPRSINNRDRCAHWYERPSEPVTRQKL
jgi:glycosyltransferase involved in cell wall biosynthesis